MSAARRILDERPRVASALEAQALVEAVLETLGALSHLVGEETELLRAGRLPDAMTREPRKAELAGIYMRGVEQVKLNAVALARFVWVFGSDGILALGRSMGVARARPMGWRQAIVLSWAGMRGVVTLAIPLTLPLDMPGRDLMLVCAFAVIFATVILQGSSLGWLIDKVRPIDDEPPAPVSMAGAETAMTRAKSAVVEKLAHGPDGEVIHPVLLELHRRRLEFMEGYEKDAASTMENLQPSFDVSLAAHAAARAELLRLHRAGQIEDDVLHNLERDLDVEEMQIIFQRGD